MAALRVFVSSTYYDLQHVRNDLHVFLKSMGYEPIMHDKGSIPYTQNVPLEQSCYDELSTCDVVVCIIGNKYGTESMAGNYSITMEELKNAIKTRKKVYTYVIKDVFIENSTYEKNKETGTFKPAFADNIKIHEFISELKETVRNHPILPFEAVTEVIENLKSQFSGLFQRLLTQETSATESKTFYDLQATADEIKTLIQSFSEQKESFFAKFDNSIFSTIPTLTTIRKCIGMNKSIFYAPDREALIEFFNLLNFEVIDDGLPFTLEVKLCRKHYDNEDYITLKDELFEKDGKLKHIRSREILEKNLIWETKTDSDSEDLPF